MKQAGSATLLFENRPYVLSAASVAGKAEEKGPYGHVFDEILADDDTIRSWHYAPDWEMEFSYFSYAGF